MCILVPPPLEIELIIIEEPFLNNSTILETLMIELRKMNESIDGLSKCKIFKNQIGY